MNDRQGNGGPPPALPPPRRAPADLRAGAARLAGKLPRQVERRAPPVESGERLITIARPEKGDRGEEIRATFDVYQGRPFVRFQTWTRNGAGDFWPDPARQFTVRAHELPGLAEAVAVALERAEALLVAGPAPAADTGKPSA